MIDFLLGVPGKLKTISDYLTANWTATRATKVDNLDAAISTRAPASTALTNVMWTDVRAEKLDGITAAVSSIISTGWPATPSYCPIANNTLLACSGGTVASTTSTSWVDALNITGSGVINLIAGYHGTAAGQPGGMYIRVTIDGVVLPTVSASNGHQLLAGALCAPYDVAAAAYTITGVTYDQINFKTSLRIEHYAASASYASNVLHKIRRFT